MGTSSSGDPGREVDLWDGRVIAGDSFVSGGMMDENDKREHKKEDMNKCTHATILLVVK